MKTAKRKCDTCESEFEYTKEELKVKKKITETYDTVKIGERYQKNGIWPFRYKTRYNSYQNKYELYEREAYCLDCPICGEEQELFYDDKTEKHIGTEFGSAYEYLDLNYFG